AFDVDLLRPLRSADEWRTYGMNESATVTVDRLVIHVTDYRRVPGSDIQSETLEVDVAVENPAGSLDQVRRVPLMELRDQTNAAYEVSYDDRLAEPIPPDEVLRGLVRFDIPTDASDLWLVVAPGDPEEKVVALG